MSKTKKPAEVKYGIEITKPHSQEMYDHNDMVAAEMKKNLLAKWRELVLLKAGWTDWTTFASDEVIVKFQKLVCYSGFGEGFTLSEVDKEVRREIEGMANWQLHETYSYGCFDGLLPRTKFMMVGHGWSKHDYHVKGADKNTSPACYDSIPCSRELDEEWANESI